MPQEDIINQPTKTKINGVSLEIIWILVILSGFLFFASLFPLPPNDFWWHLKIGELIYNQHIIPTTNMFAWTIPTNQPYFYAAWLAELLFYILFRIGGLALVISFRTLLIGIAVSLIAVETRRQSNSWRITALVIALLCLMIINNLIVRTQMWAWIPFVITYIVLKRYTELIISRYWLLACPLMMIIWVNVHGSFVLGLILIGVFLIGELLKKISKQPEKLSWNQIGWLGSAVLLSGLAVLVNPRFFGIVDYTKKLLTDPSSQKLIEEWQSPTPSGFANSFFFISILLFIILLVYSKYRLSIVEIILVVGFLWFAWSGQRYVIWYGLIITPILALLIRYLPLKAPSFVPQKNWLNFVLAVMLFIPVIFVQPWFVERLPLPATYWQQVLRNSFAGPLISIETPVAAVEYLKSHPGGKIFNEMGYGSYMIWAIPAQKTFVDTRVELFPYDQWLDYIHINNGSNLENNLVKYDVDRILLDKKLQPELMIALSENQNWKLEYDDPYSQVWSKISSP